MIHNLLKQLSFDLSLKKSKAMHNKLFLIKHLKLLEAITFIVDKRRIGFLSDEVFTFSLK